MVAWPDGFTIQDDLLLLEGIELLGIGSWDLIKSYMKRSSGEPIEVIIRHWAAVYGKGGILHMNARNVVLPSIQLYQNFKPMK